MTRSPRPSFLFVVALLLLSILYACASTPEASEAPAPTSTVEGTDPPLPSNDASIDKTEPSNPDDALAPEITSVSPDSAPVGSVGPPIVIAGNNFVPRTIVQLDGVPLATTYVSATELRATIPTSKVSTVGTLRVSVGTSPPGGGASKELPFQVENPIPALTSLSPLSVLVGSGATALHVSGTGFVSGAKVVFGSTNLPTTFLSSTALDATIPASALTLSASMPVRVDNPSPGGGGSTPIAFTIANPDATIQNINPSAAFVNSAAVTMTVTGSGFVSSSTVTFNGTALATTFTNSTHLSATVPAALLAAAGDFPVTVKNPPPGGGLSSPVVFRVQYPAPSISSIAPSSVTAGAGATVVTVTGVGFFLTSQITFDGAPAVTTFVDATHLKATLATSQLATAGSISVRVVNPAPGGGMSSALAFTVNNPGPVISALSPPSVPAGSADRTITITGTGFVTTSTAKSNGVAIATNYVSATQLSAIVPSTHLVSPGTVSITVTNAAPAGGTSAPKGLTVGCDTTGVDVALGAIGNVTTLSTNFGTAAPMSRFDASSSCNTTTIDPSVTSPGRYWVVQNTSGSSVTLSAWANCAADGQQGDAYLTFYRRPTVPASDNERLACAFVIGEGINGFGGYSSPESGASMWCPGLTKANGGGLTLAVCEKAVVHIQPWSVSNTTYTAPPTLRLKPE